MILSDTENRILGAGMPRLTFHLETWSYVPCFFRPIGCGSWVCLACFRPALPFSPTPAVHFLVSMDFFSFFNLILTDWLSQSSHFEGCCVGRPPVLPMLLGTAHTLCLHFYLAPLRQVRTHSFVVRGSLKKLWLNRNRCSPAKPNPSPTSRLHALPSLFQSTVLSGLLNFPTNPLSLFAS